MIYFVTNQKELFDNDIYKIISIEESLNIINTWKYIQFDTETSGRDAHIGKLLLAQFGSIDKLIQIVVDCTTIDIKLYKYQLENKYIIGQNLKFDIQWLYNYSIIPRKVYDTMIVEQLLYLGYPPKYKDPINGISYNLQDIAKRRCNKYIDKTIRGQINKRGIDIDVIQYAAGDVVELYDIMISQLQECKIKNCILAAKLECDFVPVIAYMEWCGIHLDEEKWKNKMAIDRKNLENAISDLNNYVCNNPNLKEFTYINTQGDLFEGFNTTPTCTINWASSKQVIPLLKKLGFNTKIEDKESGEDKDSAMEKVLKKQKGINDEFLRLYLGKGEEGDEDYYPGYNGSAKVVTSFGQNHLNAINPYTGRIHTQYWQLGADTGRMSCGSKDNNNDLAKVKGLPINPSNKQKKKGLACPYPNMQQLPSDEITRACFTAMKGNKWCSCDYSEIESRLGADIYQEKSMINEFLYGSGDMHSLCAYMVYKNIIPRDTPIKDIKKLFPHQRKEVKSIEFSQQFGGSEYAIQNAMGCTLEEAIEFKEAYSKGFPGIAQYKIKASKLVRNFGYIILCPITGHKTYWEGFNRWMERQKSFTREFWEDYKINHKPYKDKVYQEVRKHFQEVAKFDRKSLNSPTQGSGAIILKNSQIVIFNWVIDNGYFGKCLLCNLTHDECNWEYPEELKEFPNIISKTMEESAAKYCKSLPIPAEATVGDYWIH